MPQLIFHIENDYPKVHDLVTGKLSIGRSKENDILLKNSSVSAHHAELTRGDSGSFRLQDLKSQNGTAVNGDLIESKALKDGDEIRLGSVKAVFLDRSKAFDSGPPDNNLEDLKKEAAGLMRKREIERNNLKLIEDDYRQVRLATEKSFQLKEELEAELDRLAKEVETAKADLSETRKESGELADLNAEAKAFQKKSDELKIEFNSRQDACEELSRKIMAGEKLYGELDLENSIKKKETLDKDLNRLSGEIEKSRAELEENRRASKEASCIFEEAKMIETGIAEQEAKLTSRKNDCEELDRKIANGEKRFEELDLENSIKKKEELDREFDRLSREIETSKTVLEENNRAAEAAASIFEEAKVIEAGIGELEATRKSRKNDCEELENKIADREKTCEEFAKKIADSKDDLEKLTGLIESKQKQAEDLNSSLGKTEDLIRAAGERLTDIETSIRNGLDGITRAQETQKGLEKTSLSLTRIVSEKSVVLQRLKEKSHPKGTKESVCPPLRLINPGMSSLVQYFHHGAGIPGEDRVDPIGYHAFAPCTRGSMHRDADSILSENDPVLVLLSGELDKDKDLIDSVSRRIPNGILMVCWREGLLKPQAGPGLRKLLAGVSGIVSADTDTARLIDELDAGRPHLKVPIPCPVEFPDWDLSVPVSNRNRGIFVSGDGFDPDSRLHRGRLELLNQLVADTNATVTIYRQEPGVIAGLKIPGELLTTLEPPLKYSEYLRHLGKHSLVTGFGKNFAGGDVTGDAVLARAVFFGSERGNTVDELLFPDSSISGDEMGDALENTALLLSDQDAYHETMERAQGLATQLISFESVRNRLNEFIHLISGKSVS